MSFDNPWVFLLLLPVFILSAIVRCPQDRRHLFRDFRLRMIVSEICFLLFAVLLVTALAGPRWGMRIVADHRRGLDVVMAFDLSRSMSVRDLPSGISRLEKGGEIARYLAAALGDIRMGAAIGKGRGVLAVPLTYDSETMLSFLYGLDDMAITGSGTNLESLLDAACTSFQNEIPSRRLVILFSDGEELSGSLQAAAERMRRAGIAMSAVALGSEAGGPVEDTEIISVRHGALLRSTTERTGGIYVDGNGNDAALVLAQYINSLSAESRLLGYRRESNPRWRIFVLAAMAFLAVSRVLGFVFRGRDSKSRVVLYSLFFIAFFSSCNGSQGPRGRLLVMEGNFFHSRGFFTQSISSYLRALDYDEAAPYAEYGLASAYYSLEESSAALERYMAAEQSLSQIRTDNSELRYRIHYNIGIILFENGDFVEAASSFREALKVDGSRIEAKRNLELSLLGLDRSVSSQSASSSGTAQEGWEGAGRDNSVLFEYLRQKEQEQWRSREWESEGDSSGPDY